MTDCLSYIVSRIRHNGPLTFAEFMDAALYHPEFGYYSGAVKRSGRSGDFYTSVDVGPVFGELLAEQFAEMFTVIEKSESPRVRESESRSSDFRTFGLSDSRTDRFDLVEVGAGNGRLSRDVLTGLAATSPNIYESVTLRMVERSPVARSEHRTVLGAHASKLHSSGPDLPSSIRGVVFANELLDALPQHRVVKRNGSIREIYVDVEGDELVEREGPPSTTDLSEYFDRLGVTLEEGWRAEVNLAAVRWTREIASRMQTGFLVLVDYGHEAGALYSAAHAEGTLTTFTRHVVEVHDAARRQPWLRDPGASDITAHVDFTSVMRAGEEAGLETLCLVEQRRFLMRLGIDRYLMGSTGSDAQAVARRLALKTLLLPGGLGTSHHVIVFAKGVGKPALEGCQS